MTRLDARKTRLRRWPLVGLVLALLLSGASARAVFSAWHKISNGTHLTASGSALLSIDDQFDHGLHVFAIKDDQEVWQNTGTKTDSKGWMWGGWNSLDTTCNGVTCQFGGSRPSATEFTSNFLVDQLAVTARNTTTQVVWVNLFLGDPSGNGRGWTGWQWIPNAWYPTDVAIIFYSHWLYVFGQGGNGMEFVTKNDVAAGWSPNNWTTPVTIANGWPTSGAAATVEDGAIFLVVRGGSDNNYWWTWSGDGTAWEAWLEIPGPGFQSAPAVSSWPGGHVEVSGMDSGGHLLRTVTDNYAQTWSAYSPVNSATSAFPPAAFSPGTGVTRMAETQGDSTVYESDGP